MGASADAGITISPFVAKYTGDDVDKMDYKSFEGLFLTHGISLSFEYEIGFKIGGSYFYGPASHGGWEGGSLDCGIRAGMGASIDVTYGDGTYYKEAGSFFDEAYGGIDGFLQKLFSTLSPTSEKTTSEWTQEFMLKYQCELTDLANSKPSK